MKWLGCCRDAVSSHSPLVRLMPLVCLSQHPALLLASEAGSLKGRKVVRWHRTLSGVIGARHSTTWAKRSGQFFRPPPIAAKRNGHKLIRNVSLQFTGIFVLPVLRFCLFFCHQTMFWERASQRVESD